MGKLITGMAVVMVLAIASCNKKMDSFSSPPLTDYYPLEVGKFITYNLDSTVFLSFGKLDTVFRYQVQDRVDAEITDNLGRPAYRILRFIRKTASDDWTPNNTFMAVPTANTIEYVENNMRFIKLTLPVKPDFSWKGNSYIDTYSANSEVKYLDDWDYTYDSVGIPLTINNMAIDSTIKVLERDEFLGQDPSMPNTTYAERNYSVEKYGKGIGLIYREFLHWEFQSANNNSYTGYGVKLSIIDHN
jgi:hypothetical protein